MAQEVLNKDILEAIGVFSNKVEERFVGMGQHLDGFGKSLIALETNVATKKELTRIEQKVDSLIEAVDALAKLVKDFAMNI